MLLRKPEQHVRQPLQGFQLFGRHVRLVALGKAVSEEAVAADPEQDDRSEPARLATAFPGDALLEHSAAEIGVVVASRHILGRLEQLGVAQARLSSKPSELLRDENAHLRRRLPRMKNI